MTSHTPAQHVEVEGVNYYTLLELPDNQSPTAPCILLIHALMSNLHMYDLTAATLHAAGYRTLRFDLIGHHNTPAPPKTATSARRLSLSNAAAPTYHMDDLTRHIHSLVKARLSPAPPQLAGVIGCSIGGVLALRYAMLFPGEAAAIISIAAPGIATPAPAHELWAQRVRAFEADVAAGTDELCHATVNRWLPGEAAEDRRARETALGQVRTCSLEGYRLMADTIRHYDYEREVESLETHERVLVVAGSEDAAVQPETLKGVAGRIAGARFECMVGAGHLPPLHRPAEFDRLMLGFLGEGG